MTIVFSTLVTFSGFGQAKLKPKKISGQWVYLDSISENRVLETSYDFADEFYGNFARVKMNERWGIIDTSGKVIVPFNFIYIKNFQDGFAVVKFMKKRCKQAPKSQLAQKFFCRTKFGVVDSNGVLTMTKYDYIENYKNGYARVFKTPWWKIRSAHNIKWKRIDVNLIESSIPE